MPESRFGPQRPFLDPKIRFVVHVPQAEERFTPSVEDTLQADVTKKARERGVETSGGIITNFIKDDEVTFDIEDDRASVREIDSIQQAIINSFDQYTQANVTEDDIEVRAEIVRIFISSSLMD